MSLDRHWGKMMALMQNSKLRGWLTRLCSEFDHALFETDLLALFGHHAAHLAPERWLALELAYFVNRQKSSGAWLEQWNAIVEHKGIDLLLIPPDLRAWSGPALIEGSVRLELKLVDTGNWRHAWKEVEHDLDGTKTRLPATCSVCLVMHSLSETRTKRRETTLRKHEGYFDSVPDGPGDYHPPDTVYDFVVVRSTPTRTINWRHEVRARWPEFYEARVRFVWVVRPARARHSTQVNLDKS